jgi:D-aspartate ligase
LSKAILNRQQTGDLVKDFTRLSENTTGAVVIGGDYQGLGIVRSLGRRGIPVCVIDDEASISRYSRYTTRTIRVKSLREEDQVVEILLEAGKRLHLDGWVLYPTREELVAALSRFRDQLTPQFRVPTPEWETTQWAWDKRNTYQLASSLDIPTPRTWYPRERSQLAALEQYLPLVIKPAVKEHFIYATKAKAWRVDSMSELERLFCQASDLVSPGEVMIQELIPGDGRQQFSYCAFFKDGEAVGSMVAQRRRQHPPDFGRASTYVESIELPELAEISTRFLKGINYYGLVELEYKYDQREETYKLLDVNARTWGYHSLGQRAGVDFPAMLFADQLGQAVEPCQATTGVKWIRLATDLPTAMVELLHGRLDWSSYWRTLRHIDVEAVFDRHDLLPWLVEVSLLPYLALKRGF